MQRLGLLGTMLQTRRGNLSSRKKGAGPSAGHHALWAQGRGTVVLVARALLDFLGVFHVVKILLSDPRLLHLPEAPPLRARAWWVSANRSLRVIARSGYSLENAQRGAIPLDMHLPNNHCLPHGAARGACLAVLLADLPVGLEPPQAANITAPSQRRTRNHCHDSPSVKRECDGGGMRIHPRVGKQEECKRHGKRGHGSEEVGGRVSLQLPPPRCPQASPFRQGRSETGRSFLDCF